MRQNSMTEVDLEDECRCLQRYLLNMEHRMWGPLRPELRDTRYTEELLKQLKSIYRKTLR